MPYATAWDALPEVEILPGNFRRSVMGLKGSMNRIRLVHPSATPLHQHDLEEQMVAMLEGEMDVTIGDDVTRLQAGMACCIPAGTPHRFESVGGEALFLETFTPGRVQNLVGFLGRVF